MSQKLFGLVGYAVLVCHVVACQVHPIPNQSTPSQLNSVPAPATPNKILSPVNVPIVVKREAFVEQTVHGAVTGTGLTRRQGERFKGLVLSEFGKYPPSLLGSTKTVSSIVLCTTLAFAGQRRTGVPNFQNRKIFFDVLRGQHSAYYQRRVVHHEMYHMIDWLDDYKVYTDKKWAALNPPTFKYGNGGKTMQNDPMAGVVQTTVPGFMTRYATSGVEEDKAELFSFMMVDPVLVKRHMKTDALLRKKVTMMKNLMYSYDSSFDDEFWKKQGF